MSKRVPIFDPDRSFRVWAIHEIYTGEAGTFIPNVNDAVWDWENGLYRVIAIDVETGLSTLERFSFIPQNPNIHPDDILLGAVPGRVSETYRLYVNDRTDPITAVADNRLFIYGSDNEYIRYFRGFDISEAGKVISIFYDEDNNLKDDKIPLELVNVPEGTNRAIKTPLPGYVSGGLEDGEVVTCVIYSSAGIVSSVNPLLVKNTGFVRGVQLASKFITHLTINSPFLVGDDQERLEVPLHTPLKHMDITVNIHYSNGLTETVAPDGSKVIIEGLEVFKVSQAGRTIAISIIYLFYDNEANYNSNADDGRSITKIYQLTTMNPLDTGVVKIFVLPTWSSEIDGWNLHYYLYNLHRSLVKDVSEDVRVIEPAGKGFDPKDYGNLQRLKLAIDTGIIEETGTDYTYTQEFNITLFSPINENVPSWTFTYSDVGDIIYGDSQVAKFTASTKNSSVDISQGLSDLTTWIDLMHLPMYPLLQPESSETIVPTHVSLNYREQSIEVPVEKALEPIIFPLIPLAGDTLVIKWIIRLETKDLQIAISPLVIV